MKYQVRFLLLVGVSFCLHTTPISAETWNQGRKLCNGTVEVVKGCTRWISNCIDNKITLSLKDLEATISAVNSSLKSFGKNLAEAEANVKSFQKDLDDAVEYMRVLTNKRANIANIPENAAARKQIQDEIDWWRRINAEPNFDLLNKYKEEALRWKNEIDLLQSELNAATAAKAKCLSKWW